MKYVMLEPFQAGCRTPVFGVAPFTHRDLAKAFASTHRPVSAGFCEPGPNGTWITSGFSSSLSLGPAVGDAAVIAASVRATIAMVPQSRPAA